MNAQQTQRTLELLNAIKAQQVAQKAITTSLGLTWYDLEPVAKQLYPVITPLRNMIPRVKGDGGTATNWKAVTGINATLVKPGVSEGNRGAIVTTNTANYTAAYKGIGLEDYVTFEADYAAENFDDVRALAVENLLRAVFIEEEKLMLFGNASLALGTCPNPTLSVGGTGGTIATSTQSVKVVALTYDGFLRSSVAGGVIGSIAKTNADGSSDTVGGGSSNKSAGAVTIAITLGQNLTMSLSAAVKGAYAYAWYWGTVGNELLGAITTVTTNVATAAAAGTQNASAITADNSTDTLVFDGFTTQALNSTGLFSDQAALALTADNAGGIVEIDKDLKSFWDNYRLGPQYMFVNSQELVNITKKVISGGAAPLFRFTVDSAAGAGSVSGLTLNAGSVIGTYLNKYTMAGGELVKVMLHPNVPPGTIVYYSVNLPYPLSNVRNIIQMKARKEYYQLEWPLKSRKYEYGVYADELMQIYAPFAFGVRTNILNG